MIEQSQLVIIILGPPGSGKGTHAVELSKELNIPHISTGDLFRENLNKETSLGNKAKSYIEKGHLVPDEIVLDMLFKRISNADCEKGYILDGFPRTLDQAKSFNNRISEKNKVLAINLNIEDEQLIKRITGRIICKDCGASFHKKYIQPKTTDICDYCQGELYQRKDDTIDVVKERLKIYHTQTHPLINFYKANNTIFYEISADDKKSIIFSNILKKIRQNS